MRRATPPECLRNRHSARRQFGARAMERIVVRSTEKISLHLGQSGRPTWGCSSNTVSARMPLTTRETRHTARTSTLQTFRTPPIVWHPSDGSHSRPILHGNKGLRSISIDMERASNTVSALMTLTTRETRHTARTSTLQTFRAPIVWRPSNGTYSCPIHGKDCDLSRTIRIDRQERESNAVSALMPLTTRETRHTTRTST